MGNKNIMLIAVGTALLLLVPLVAMQFNTGMNWSVFDFVVAGVLLFGSGLTYELVSRKMGSIPYRLAVGLAVLTALFLVWVNLAVGIIGSERNPANLMYLGVLATGLIGAIVARLQPQGMARTLYAMAFAQVMVPVIALIVWKPVLTLEPPGVLGVFVLNALIAMLFVGSALLFRRAGYQQLTSSR
jgi:hypothetical protein